MGPNDPCGSAQIELAPWCEGRSKAARAGSACTARRHGPAVAIVAGLAVSQPWKSPDLAF